MAADQPPINLGRTLGLAVVLASDAPLLLLDENLAIVAASDSFCAASASIPKPSPDRRSTTWTIIIGICRGSTR